MLKNQLNKISFIGVFLIFSLLLLNIKPLYPLYYAKIIIKSKLNKQDIYVPPAEDSHPKCCPSIGRISVPNTWKNLPPDNNIPGLLPGPRPGEQLGLENNKKLSLSTPIRAPLVDNIFPKSCNTKSYCKSQKYNPYNGSYIQCTNNYF